MTIVNTYAWAAVDQTENPVDYADYLDTVTALGEIGRYKRRTYALLDPRPGSRILDVGCGVGDDVRALARLAGAEGFVVGVDNSHALIAEARRRAVKARSNVTFRVEDAAHLRFADDTFDACRADRVFMHLPDRRGALAEMIRVTSPGGRIVAMDPDWDSLVIDASDKALTRRILTAVADATANAWSGRQLYRLFQEAGLVDAAIADTVTLVVTDLELVNRLYKLEETLGGQASNAALTPSEAGFWLDDLRTADQAGRFFCALTGFTVVGRVP